MCQAPLPPRKRGRERPRPKRKAAQQPVAASAVVVPDGAATSCRRTVLQVARPCSPRHRLGGVARRSARSCRCWPRPLRASEGGRGGGAEGSETARLSLRQREPKGWLQHNDTGLKTP
eukprot:scaffold4725_cov367-Prasinococcus_capsulatus_cf.AAC.9